jgi:FlaA1/EpsC-like NDP-sugar epimerase
VKIADVARRFADQHVPPLEIVYTGLRPGEKLHEDLIADGESGERPFHPMITHVAGDPIDLEAEGAIRAVHEMATNTQDTSPRHIGATPTSR